MADIERKLGFGRSSLIALALLLGSDYSQGVHGFGPETACRVVKSIGDDSVLHKAVSEGLALRRKSKGTKKTGKDPCCDENKENDLCYTQHISEKGQQNSTSSDQFLQVIDAYLKPKCHSPDSEAVQRVCSQHPFVRTRLQEICTQFFGWNPDKTDEYILPKIAERNLRRFSNLRTVSSELGVKIPLDKMSVPCPVSAIVKQRKVQGRDYFKVSWREMEGLLTCSVPADLMESACPEKIAEFMEKKCEAKKKQCRKPRPRKSTKGGTSEIDLQLQGLMLSIESHSSAPYATECRQDSTGPVHNIRSDMVIDLSSPSPPISARKVSNVEKMLIGWQI
ncbi:flap endonuclease GEN-like 2 [Iris pallida]|uniref:Flap endonuclease GEN-like 2 n=1 Tax=Iris pallida TaxID=29817 RepID=A0AAX6GNV4_IRIPA|nr:flap endonuclease GEN-like 2 [Iris pallida]